MKKTLLLFFSLSIALTGFAKQYCNEPITSRDGHTATVTMSLVSGNIYEFSITTSDNIVSFNAAGSNLYCEKDGKDGFTLIGQVEVDPKDDPRTLLLDLEDIASEYGFTVKLQHKNIFVATNQLRKP